MINLSDLSDLFECKVSNNPLREVNLSGNPKIALLEAENMSEMNSINLKNGAFDPMSSYQILKDNPQLSVIYCDEGQEEACLRTIIKTSSQDIAIIAQ